MIGIVNFPKQIVKFFIFTKCLYLFIHILFSKIYSKVNINSISSNKYEFDRY